MNEMQTMPTEEEFETVSLLDYLFPLLRWRWLIFGACAVFGVLGILSALSKSPYYTATAHCIPRGSLGDTDELRSLSGTRGKSWDKVRSASDIVKYYNLALKVRPLMQKLLESEFETEELGRASLLDVMTQGADEHPEGERDERAVKALREALKIGSGGGKLLTVSFSSAEAGLSANAVNTLLDEYEKLPGHTDEATADMKFIEERVKKVRERLEEKEKAIAQLKAKSLDTRQPDAIQRLAALEREARLLEKQYENLNQEHAKAEIRMIQLQSERSGELDVLERAEPPLERAGPNRRKIVVVFIFIGLVLSTGASFVIEYFRNMRQVFSDHPFWVLFPRAKRDLIVMSALGLLALLLLIGYMMLR